MTAPPRVARWWHAALSSHPSIAATSFVATFNTAAVVTAAANADASFYCRSRQRSAASGAPPPP